MFSTLYRVLRAGSLAALLALPVGAQAQHDHPSPAAAALPDRPAVHGMLVFGTGRVYASHLPMFHPPHHYQAVFELVLSDSAQQVYEASRRAYPAEPVYTLEPERFVLPELVAAPRPFRATLYRGHFERGGTPIARGQVVRIRRTLCFRPLEATPPAAHASYLLVGDAQQQFLVHRIAGRPGFDQVLSVGVAAAGTRRLGAQGVLGWQLTAGSRCPRRALFSAASASAAGRCPCACSSSSTWNSTT